MAEIVVTSQNFETEVLHSDIPVLIDFWAPWCGPCKMLGPVIENIAEEYKDIKVCKINVDEEMELAAEYRVSSIPTILFMKGGEVKNKAVGYRSKDEITAWF